MARRLSSRAALLACLLASGACASLRDDYSTPEVGLPAAWTYADPATAQTGQISTRASEDAAGFTIETDRWWMAFNDERLNRFIASVAASNNGLAEAAVSARRARLQARLNAAQLGPQISASANASQDSAGGEAAYSASASISYEIDLWGRVDALRDAADWEAQASEEDRQAVALSLTGSAATLYWQLAYINLQIASGEESVAYAERTRTLVQAQYDAGAVSGLELNEAEQTVQSQRAALTLLAQTRVETRNAIAALRDGEAWPQQDEPNALPEDLPQIEAGLPAEILGRRPDLRAAELRLRGTLASGDATKLSYYPTIGLTASGNSSSTSLSQLLSDPLGAIAASLSLPFLQANEMRLASQISEADYEAAMLDFRQKLREALVEVENALSALTQYEARGDQLEGSLRAAETAERLYEARYRAGAATLRDWLDAQERRRQAALSLQQNQVTQLSNQITLYLALGGDARVGAT